MWEPVGPLPASVYWRRRWVAAVSVVVLALAVWGVSVVITSDAPTRNGTAAYVANRAALTAPQQDSPSPARAEPVSGPEVAPQALSKDLDSGPAAPGTAGPETTDPGGAEPAPSAGPPPTGPPPTAPALTPTGTPAGAPAGKPTGTPTGAPPAARPADVAVAEGRPDELPRQAPTVAAPVPVPSTGPVPCTNAMITTAAETARPQYAPGDRPVFRLVITNVSGQPCVRDLAGARQEIVVWSGDRSVRLWSSNDCITPGGTDLRTLVPGQPVVFAVTWAGRTSAPGCAGARTVVTPGPYQVMTRLDDVISAPTPFALVA